jgi:hypothetical protein
MPRNVKAENLLQVQAMKECKHPETLAFITEDMIAFRSVIESYKEEFDRLPTVSELLWCASEIVKHDIRKD